VHPLCKGRLLQCRPLRKGRLLQWQAWAKATSNTTSWNQAPLTPTGLGGDTLTSATVASLLVPSRKLNGRKQSLTRSDARANAFQPPQPHRTDRRGLRLNNSSVKFHRWDAWGRKMRNVRRFARRQPVFAAPLERNDVCDCPQAASIACVDTSSHGLTGPALTKSATCRVWAGEP